MPRFSVCSGRDHHLAYAVFRYFVKTVFPSLCAFVSVSLSPLLPLCFSHLLWSDFWKTLAHFGHILSYSLCPLWSGFCSQHYRNCIFFLTKATNDLDWKIQRKPFLLLSYLTSLPRWIGRAVSHFSIFHFSPWLCMLCFLWLMNGPRSTLALVRHRTSLGFGHSVSQSPAGYRHGKVLISYLWHNRKNELEDLQRFANY